MTVDSGLPVEELPSVDTASVKGAPTPRTLVRLPLVGGLVLFAVGDLFGMVARAQLIGKRRYPSHVVCVAAERGRHECRAAGGSQQ